jgi:hypothetical membrane protein
MRLYTAAAGLLTAIILVAQAVAPAPYSWTLLSMSHLGAQGYEYAFIMRLGLVSYGALVVVAALLKVVKRPRTGWPHGFIGVYGFAILLTGFFSTAPFLQGVSFSKAEANLHSTFASLAGIALSAAMVAFAVMAHTPRGRIIHLVALVLTLLIPEVFVKFSDAGGVLQRLIWLVVLAWFAVLEIPSLQADFRQPLTLPSA